MAPLTGMGCFTADIIGYDASWLATCWSQWPLSLEWDALLPASLLWSGESNPMETKTVFKRNTCLSEYILLANTK